MLFNSLTFVVFFAVVLALYHAVRSWPARKSLLLVASYLFYAAWNPPFVVLLWFSTVVDWFAARRLHAATERAAETGESARGARWGWVLVSLVANLGLLAFFKYGGFFLDNFVGVAGFYGVAFQPAKPDVILPVGISFYTFQTLSYTLDVFHRRARPATSFLDYALYVTFFPQLVAGPIVRAGQFLPQCVSAPAFSRDRLGWGLFLMTLGLFQKVVLADAMLAPAAETVFGAGRALHPFDAWMGVLAFSGQIFFDFAGYSTTAIGAALCLGFSLPDNFRCPYGAVGFSDFWRRWHISLSSWLRDYLYIPLGGNRKGSVRTNANLLVTMLLGGLWHGASWTFVAWGGLHGLYLAVERGLARAFGSQAWVRAMGTRLLLGLLTYALVNVTWVFFRSEDFGSAGLLLASMFGAAPDGAQVLPTLDLWKVGVVIALLVASHTRFRSTSLEDWARGVPGWVHALAWAAMLILLVLTQGTDNAFIYFQF